MKNLINESICLISEARQKLMSVGEQYPHLDNVEYEICENITRSEKLISELKILLKILPNESKTINRNEQAKEVCSYCGSTIIPITNKDILDAYYSNENKQTD